MTECISNSQRVLATPTPRVRILRIGPVVSTPKRDGSQIIAHFDAEIPHVQLRRWSIIRTADGCLGIASPIMISGRNNHSDKRAIHVPGYAPGLKITDDALHQELFQAAVRAWRGHFGGEAEGVPIADNPPVLRG